MSQHDSHENAKEFVVMSPPRHATSNRIMNCKCEPKTQMQTLKIEHDIHETSMRHPMRHFSRLATRLLMGFACTLNDNKSIPQTVFTNNNKMRTVWF